MALSIAIGPVATSSLYAVLSNRTSWFQKLDISPEAKEELLFWQEYFPRLEGQSIWQSPSAVRVVYSDASGTGHAGCTIWVLCQHLLGCAVACLKTAPQWYC